LFFTFKIDFYFGQKSPNYKSLFVIPVYSSLSGAKIISFLKTECVEFIWIETLYLTIAIAISMDGNNSGIVTKLIKKIYLRMKSSRGYFCSFRGARFEVRKKIYPFLYCQVHDFFFEKKNGKYLIMFLMFSFSFFFAFLFWFFGVNH